MAKKSAPMFPVSPVKAKPVPSVGNMNGEQYISHTIEIDKKGVKHHRITHNTNVHAEPKNDHAASTLINNLLANRK